MTATLLDPVGRPLLGVAGGWGSAEVELSRRFDALHQLIYVNGGIRPTNAAVEEVAKLILIRLWALRHPTVVLDSGTRASTLFQPGTGARRLGPDLGLAFTAALRAPDLQARTPAGRTEPVWPYDEPFRLA
ncbi:MAG TPA: hypothetical protein VF163_10775, partial [Micromonosporaceae bacterium]